MVSPPPEEPAGESEELAVAPGGASGRAPRRRIPGGAVTVLALVAVLLAVATGFAVARWRNAAATADARAQALAAGRIAAVELLAYDYRDLSADFARGLAATTGAFRRQYELVTHKSVEALAPRYHVVVTAVVRGAGVVHATPGAVSLLVFVDQSTTSSLAPAARVYQDRVLMRLVRTHGRWLVDSLQTL